MKRCVMKLDPKKESSRIARWQSIAEAAAKQSKRGIIPEVGNVLTFGAAVEEAKSFDRILLPYEMAEGMERTRQILESIRPGERVAVFIGPEGGFDPEEVERAVAVGAESITLGKRILRTETAGMVVLSWLGYLTEGKV
jgi:16S rRNA (uracil1498-N3)-methyltransferase